MERCLIWNCSTYLMGYNQPVVFRAYRRPTTGRRVLGTSFRGLVVNLPEVWFCFGFFPNTAIIIPGVRATNGHTGIDLTIERFEGIVTSGIRVVGRFCRRVGRPLGNLVFLVKKGWIER